MLRIVRVSELLVLSHEGGVSKKHIAVPQVSGRSMPDTCFVIEVVSSEMVAESNQPENTGG